MDQVRFFLAEYAMESGMLLLALMAILLLATLHRMRRMRRQLQELTGNTERILTGMEQMPAKLRSEMLCEASMEAERMAEVSKSRGESFMKADWTAKHKAEQSGISELGQKAEQDAGELQAAVGRTGGTPEELIDAVIEEVFP